MSSTEPDASAEIGALFDAELVPLAEALRARGVEAFPSKPDPTLESYFVRRPRPAMRPEDFLTPSCDGFDDFEERLVAHWKSLGREELAELAPRFADLARASYALAEQDAEVNPFVYVMF